jgi:hypothetical protein
LPHQSFKVSRRAIHALQYEIIDKGRVDIVFSRLQSFAILSVIVDMGKGD